MKHVIVLLCLLFLVLSISSNAQNVSNQFNYDLTLYSQHYCYHCVTDKKVLAKGNTSLKDSTINEVFGDINKYDSLVVRHTPSDKIDSAIFFILDGNGKKIKINTYILIFDDRNGNSKILYSSDEKISPDAIDLINKSGSGASITLRSIIASAGKDNLSRSLFPFSVCFQ